MTDKQLPSLAKTNPELHIEVGDALCGMATAINAELGPSETVASFKFK